MVSVTEVLDYYAEPDLVAWYLREGKAKCERISNEAKRVGKVVDQVIQDDVRAIQAGGGQSCHSDDEAIENCLRGWQLFKQEHPEFLPSVVGVQTELRHGELVGHPDFLLLKPTWWGVLDLKTSKTIQPKAWVQTAKYLDLWKRTGAFGTPAQTFLAILRLDKQTGLYEYRVLDHAEEIQHEIAVFDAYYLAYQHGERVREVFRRQLEQEVLDVP